MVVVTLTGNWSAAATSRATAGVKYGAGRPRMARVGYQPWTFSSRWREGSDTGAAIVPTCSDRVGGGTASLGDGVAAGRASAAVGLLVVACAGAVVPDAAQSSASALTPSPAGRISFIISSLPRSSRVPCIGHCSFQTPGRPSSPGLVVLGWWMGGQVM